MEPPSSYLSPLMPWMKQMSLEKSCTEQHNSTVKHTSPHHSPNPWGDIPLKGHHNVLPLPVLLMWGEKTEKALLWISHQEAPAELMHYLSYTQATCITLVTHKPETSRSCFGGGRGVHRGNYTQGQGPSGKNDNVIILSTCQALCWMLCRHISTPS